jgi:hypothetical protein
VSDPGLRGWRTCALAVPIAALLAAIGLGTSDGGAQSAGTHCDAAYCYVQTCERRPAPSPACRYISERVCRPVMKQECTTRNVQRCHTVTDQACQYRSVNECKSVNKYVCKPTYKRVAEAQEDAAEGAQPVQSLQKPVLRKARPLRTVRRYQPHRQAAPQQQRRPNTWVGRPNRPYPPYQKSDRTTDRGRVARGSQAPDASKPHGSNQPASPQQQCAWQMQNVCAPVAKQECRPISKQVCNDYPEQTCYPRQVQDCHEERRQVCDPAQPPQVDCRPRPVQRACTPPQYWTPQGCVTAPAPTLPSITDGGKKPIPNENVKPPTDYGGPPSTSTIKPGDNKGPDTAKLEPLPAPYEPPKVPYPPQPEKVEPPAPSDLPSPPEARKESSPPPSPAPRGTTVDVNLNGRTWRVELDPVPIATGAGLALLLGLLALWPKRKDVPTDADHLARLGIECRVEPDLGEQAVTHLERPPVGPRITVRATPGSRRHGIVMR